jgi:hypothetical protein
MLIATRDGKVRVPSKSNRNSDEPEDKGVSLTSTVAKCLGDAANPGDAKYGEGNISQAGHHLWTIAAAHPGDY